MSSSSLGFYERTGNAALGSRLRRLSETVTRDAARLYAHYGVPLHPKWFPVFFVLADGTEKTITAIAHEIGHSHPSVSRIVREMRRQRLLLERGVAHDRRKTAVRLSAKGRAARARLDEQFADVRCAIEKASAEARHDLWEALSEWEYLLQQRSLLRRVLDEKRSRESRDVRVVDYQPSHEEAFRRLNEAWITKYFSIEESDRNVLDAPDRQILQKGGHILVAELGERVAGVCALLKMPDGGYELAKMAVDPEFQGRGIGLLLGQAAVARARSSGAPRVYLESNTKLKPAITLYEKLGFRKVVAPPSPYARSNIQMELRFA
jgi:ribosomal protein S18 acetylase RimI-like enzyme